MSSKIKQKFTLHPTNPEKSSILVNASFAFPGGWRYAAYIFALFLTGCFALMVIYDVGYRLRREQAFQSEGQRITGQVINCAVYRSKNTVSVRSDYSYEVVGQIYTVENASLSGESCANYTGGTPLEILYLPSNPSISVPVESQTAQFDLIFGAGFQTCLGVILLFLAFGLSQLFYRDRQARHAYERLKKKQVLLEGEIVSISGEIVSTGTTNSLFNHYLVIVDYQFDSPHNTLIRGRSKMYRRDLYGKPLPPVGTPITVLYADDHAHMML